MSNQELSYKERKNLFKMEANYWKDFCDAVRFWDNKPLIDAYFPADSDIEMTSFEHKMMARKQNMKNTIDEMFQLQDK